MEKKQLVGLAKDVGVMATGFGVASIILDAVKFVSPGKVGILSKGCKLLGAAALSSLVSDKCTDYVEAQIDKFEASLEVEPEEEPSEESENEE